MKRRIWDNANIIESYPGICTPLTFSFARSIYRDVYSQLMDAFRIDRGLRLVLRRHYDAFLGYLGGRFYYNLETWCILVSYLPGSNRNPAMLQEMMGVRESDRLTIPTPRISFRQHLKGFILGVWYHFRLPARTRRWLADFEKDFPPFVQRIATLRDAESLMEMYFEIERRFLYDWTVPILNDIAVMIYSGSLRRLVQRKGGDDIQPEWLTDIGSGGNVRMIGVLRDMAGCISGNQVLQQLVVSGNPDKAWEQLLHHKDTAALCQRLIRDFGMRNGNDLKLETPNFRERPGEFVPIIRQYIHHTWFVQEAPVTQAPRGAIFRWLLCEVRRSLNQREEMRLKRSQIFGVIREIFLRIGDDFRRQGLLEAVDDIFFIEVEECFQLIRSTSTVLNVRPLIAQRRQEYEQAKLHSMPPHVVTEAFMRRHTSGSGTTQTVETELVGRPNYPARVEAEAIVMLEPDFKMDVRGKILVCRQTDPSWTPILGLVKGLVVERGGILSHAAIFSRELRIPSVLGVEQATERIRTGQRIRLEGKTGKVLIV